MENGMKISVWKMEDFKNGMEDNLSYFHTRFRAWHTEKYIHKVIRNMWKRLAAYHLRQITRIIRS